MAHAKNTSQPKNKNNWWQSTSHMFKWFRKEKPAPAFTGVVTIYPLRWVYRHLLRKEIRETVSAEHWLNEINANGSRFSIEMLDKGAELSSAPLDLTWWTLRSDIDMWKSQQHGHLEMLCLLLKAGEHYNEGVLLLTADFANPKLTFRKPTMFDAMFENNWQPAPDDCPTGLIVSPLGTITEMISAPVSMGDIVEVEVVRRLRAPTPNPGIVQMLQNVDMVALQSNLREQLMGRHETWNGGLHRPSFEDGIWRLFYGVAGSPAETKLVDAIAALKDDDELRGPVSALMSDYASKFPGLR